MKHTENEGHHRIEYSCKCYICKGTGLYVGSAERDGFSVVCNVCKGKGQRDVVIEWDDFTGRVIRGDIITVLEVNPGIDVGLKGKGALRFTHQSFGGMSYEDWYKGKPFPECSENRKLTCPSQWYQSADCHKAPSWRDCWGSTSFSRCLKYEHKDECWVRFDVEQVGG